MKKYVCECCGGQINPATMKCEYCGTQYKHDIENHVIRLETYTNPVDTFRAEVQYTNEELEITPLEIISEYALKSLANKLSESIYNNMVVQHEYDPLTREHRVRGTIKIIKPEKTERSWIE